MLKYALTKEAIKISKKIYILIICMALISMSISFGEELIRENEIVEETELEEFLPVTVAELGSPKYLMAEFNGEYFILTWTNDRIDYSLDGKYEYQVDYKVGRGKWLSERADEDLLPTYNLEVGLYGKTAAIFDPIFEGISYEDIDLSKNSYNIRVRYRYAYLDDGVEKYIYGYFSSPVNLGLQPYYTGASDWAIDELDKAVEYGLIPESIRSNMQSNITREEFCELVLKMYEKLTNHPAPIGNAQFSDTNNIDVLKAAGLGIAVGIGDGQFAPDNFVTRQEMAVMIKRTLALVYPNFDFTSEASDFSLDDDQISDWALSEVRFLSNRGILKGDYQGNILPLGNTTREQAVAIVLRSYEMFK